MREWWNHLDTLAAEAGTRVSYGFRVVRAAELSAWFRARQQVLFAIAAHARVAVPHPDPDSGEVALADRVAGVYGFRPVDR